MASASSAGSPGGLLAEQSLEAQIGLLRAEEHICEDPIRRAALLYETASLIEEKQANDSLAIRDYLAAVNLAPQFRPPLYALIRMFERRRSFKNLIKLYEAEANSAVTAREKASALVDSGVLLADHLEQAELGHSMIEEAGQLDPSLQCAWLMLERTALCTGDQDAAERALLALAKSVDTPEWKAILNAEAAITMAERNRVDEAIKLLRSCSDQAKHAGLYLQQLEHIARTHGRHHALVEALENQAALIQKLDGREVGSLACLWGEAARLRARHGADPSLVIQNFRLAHAAAPEEMALTMEWCNYAAEHRPDSEVLNHIRSLQNNAPPASLHAALRVLEAEVAQALGQRDVALKALEQASAFSGDSCAARTLVRDYSRQGQSPQTRLQALVQHSAHDKAHSFSLQWEAGQIAADELLDASKARSLYQSAAQSAPDSTPVRRELYGGLLRLGDLYAAREVGAALLDHDIDDAERSALLRDQYELLRDVFGDLQATEELLTSVLQIPAAKTWAPDAARIFAAMNDNSELCGTAHMALAEQCDDDRLAASHYCAAARAFARAHQPSSTLDALRKALALVPDHRYALALMQYLVQAGDRSPALITLFKQSAMSTAEPSGLESSLLAPAFESELNQDFAGAIQTYRQLSQLNPNAVAAFSHLRRVALRLGRKELLQEALEGLAARESAAGRSGLAVFELAEFRDLVSADVAGSKSLLFSVLHHPDVGISAAWMLLMQPKQEGDPDQRHAAVLRLLGASNGAKPAGLQRELISLSLTDASDKGVEAVADTIDDLLQSSSQDMWGHLSKYRSLRHRPLDVSPRAEALMQMARATSDRRIASDLMLHAVRTSILSETKDAQDDAVIFAHELDPHADPLAAAMAFDETLGSGDDPEMRAKAFEVWMQHVGPEWTINARAALGRALVAGGRYTDAIRVLGDVVAQSPDDLGAWEAMRYAARHAGMWAVAARACDRLSKHGPDGLRATLLEESALIWANELDNTEEAEPRLRKALALNPALRQAYDLYHRLLRSRNDTVGLIDLVRMRLVAVDTQAERCRLFYEQAILYRSIGNLEDCKHAVMQMLEIEPKHVGGLALFAETATMLEQWDTAIAVLRELAQAEVPASQRRLSRLTAANLLERKKNDPRAALTELRLLEQSGDHDPELLQRSALLAERTQQFEHAIISWTQLAQTASGSERAAIEKRIARIYTEHLHDRAAAIDAYQSALDADLTDVDACEALLAHTSDSHVRHQLIFSFREEIYRALKEAPLEPVLLRKLLRAALWAQDLDRERTILDVLTVLDLASAEERLRWQDLHSRSVPTIRGVVEDDMLQILSASPSSGPVAMAAQIVAQALGNKPAQELKRLGVDKSARVKRKAASQERDQLVAICTAFRVRVADVYVGGHTREGIAALDESGASIWILGHEVTAPFAARSRFAVGQLIYGLRTGQVSLMRRQSDQTAALLFDIAEAMGVSFAQSASFFDPEGLAPIVMRGLSHKGRKTLEALWPQLDPSGDAIVNYCQALERSATRNGLMLAGDLEEALRFIVGHVVDRNHVLTSSLATDLLGFWISDSASLFRKRMAETE